MGTNGGASPQVEDAVLYDGMSPGESHKREGLPLPRRLANSGTERSGPRCGGLALWRARHPFGALILANLAIWVATTGCEDQAEQANDASPGPVGADTRPGTAKGPARDAAGTKNSMRGGGNPRRMADAADESPAIPVAVAQVQRGTIEAYYEGSTNLSAEEEAVVVARTQGVVEALFAEEGDVVEAGQPLAQLETERLTLELARSRAQLERLKTAFERAERMFDARMISPNDHDDAKFAYEAEQTNLRLREYDLKEATIRATIDGVVTRRHIKVGHTLNPSTPAFEMKRLDAIEAEVNVPEREIGRIHKGQYARVRIDALADEQFDGEVARVAPEVDPTSGTFRVTVTLGNDDGRLKPGMFARVDVRIDQRPNALLAPLDAVVSRRDDSSVFVVEGGTVGRRSVETGYVSDGNVEILAGVHDQEWVVITGQRGLRSGTRVVVVDENGPLGSE